LDAVGALWQQLVDYHVQVDGRLPPAVAGGGQRYARRLYDKLDDPYARLLVAEQGGAVVGFVFGMIVDLAPDMFEQEVSGFLADIFVAAEHRQGGVGRELVKTLEAWFAGRGVRHYEWHVAAQNENALAFWRALGGEPMLVRMRAEVNGGDA
jgi:GNAT superfamily N-acetyltransferase